jgi:hypothetical protein
MLTLMFISLFNLSHSQIVGIIYMGSVLQKQFKNYTVPTLAQSEASEFKPIKSTQSFYATNLLPECYEVPCYSLKTKRDLSSEMLRTQIY